MFRISIRSSLSERLSSEMSDAVYTFIQLTDVDLEIVW